MTSVSTSRRVLETAFLGTVPYDEAVAMQEARREAVIGKAAPDALLMLEHPHVFTVGRNASESDVLADASWLESRSVSVARSSRGGQVTYHGPGQLVGYPIVDLSPDRQDIRRYVRDLQEVLLRTLGHFGIEAKPRRAQPEIGVWVGERKVASIGVHIRKWVTLHGFALNVSTDLSFFDGIVACGLDRVEMASIESLTGRTPPLPEVAEVVGGHFAEVFDRSSVPEALR